MIYVRPRLHLETGEKWKHAHPIIFSKLGQTFDLQEQKIDNNW